MAFRNRRRERDESAIEPAVEKNKILDVDATMQGSLTFRDAVNLRINGKFEGTLDTKGSLTIGKNAQVKANIVGEDIVVSGKVFGNVTASISLSLTQTAYLLGDVQTPSLNVAAGAILQGKCDMQARQAKVSRSTIEDTLMTVEELAKYLEVDTSSITAWARSGRIPAQKEGSSWKFERRKIDSWIASEQIDKK